MWFSHVEMPKPLRRPRSCGAVLGALFAAPRRTVSRPSCRRTSPTRPGTTSPARWPATPAAQLDYGKVCCSGCSCASDLPLAEIRKQRASGRRSAMGASIDRPRNQLYGYDRERFDDATTLNDTTPRTTPSPPRRRHTRPTLNVTRTEDPLLLPLIYSISRTSNSYAFSSDLRS